jgi:tetratricopeptide (TPR) repeat protein
METHPKIDGGIMAKKVSRKKLLKKPDEFFTSTGRLIQFCKTHQKQFIWGFGALFIIIAIISIYKYNAAKNELKASLLLSETQAKYKEAFSLKGPEDALKEVEKDFQKLIDDYPRKMAGKHGRFIFADIYFDAGKIDQAIELYKVSLTDWSKESAIKNMILSSIGYAYKKKKDYQKALTYYEKISNGAESIGKANALYNLGIIYAKLNKTEKSLEVYKEVDQNYSDFIYAEIVKDKIRP